MGPAIALLFLAVGISCAPPAFQGWKGETLEGTPFDLSRLKAPIVAVNVYSPTCVPCIDELPALDLLGRELSKKEGEIFLLVDGNPEKHGLAASASQSDLRNRLQADVKKYGIRAPVVIMDAAFKTAEPGAFITGTPETIFFRTGPLTPVYLFLGPIMEGQPFVPEEDSRFRFVLSQLEAM